MNLKILFILFILFFVSGCSFGGYCIKNHNDIVIDHNATSTIFKKGDYGISIIPMRCEDIECLSPNDCQDNYGCIDYKCRLLEGYT